MARQRANDLAELGVDIELFPMPKPDQFQKENMNDLIDEMEEVKGDQMQAKGPIFDIKKFYANIISYDED